MQVGQVAVVGSGIAGMAIAIRLASMGHKVKVYEKNDEPGGKISLLELDGFRFDKGPSLFVEPENILELFSIAGESACGEFSYSPLPIACRYFFEGGTELNAYASVAQFADELADKLGEDRSVVNRYLDQARRLYEGLGSVFLNHSLHRRETWIRWSTVKSFARARPVYFFRSLASWNLKQFRNPKTVQIFNRYATYNGSDPFRVPAILCMIPHLELNKGAFYPKGGMISIVNSLYRLAIKKGIEFQFGAEVKQILHQDHRVRGIRLANYQEPAGIVVSNSDIFYTYQNLLADPSRAKRVQKLERSASAMVFYWGMKKKFDRLQLHNIFFSGNYREEFRYLFTKYEIYDDPTIYINISSKMEACQAPEGKENWFVLVNAPVNRGQNWEELKHKLRENILAKLERILNEPVRPFIEVEAVMNPSGIEESSLSFMGSLYGTSSNTPLSAFLRNPNFTSHLAGLYCCGGTVHPGGGIPLCLRSAKIVSGLIKKDIENGRI